MKKQYSDNTSVVSSIRKALESDSLGALAMNGKLSKADIRKADDANEVYAIYDTRTGIKFAFASLSSVIRKFTNSERIISSFSAGPAYSHYYIVRNTADV